jgi:hypothetical protein
MLLVTVLKCVGQPSISVGCGSIAHVAIHNGSQVFAADEIVHAHYQACPVISGMGPPRFASLAERISINILNSSATNVIQQCAIPACMLCESSLSHH